MTKIIFSLVFFSSMAYSYYPSWIQPDKFKHIVAGIIIYILFLTFLKGKEVFKYALIPVIIIGFGKEVLDAYDINHNAEFLDFIATVALPFAFYLYIKDKNVFKQRNWASA